MLDILELYYRYVTKHNHKSYFEGFLVLFIIQTLQHSYLKEKQYFVEIFVNWIEVVENEPILILFVKLISFHSIEE